jgi:hypothetical protein
MKNFSYLIILLFSITLASCGDINEFTPTVQVPDAEWKMSYVTSLPGSPTTTIASSPEKFQGIIDNTNRTITINHTFHDDSRAWFSSTPDVKLVNTVTGPQIEITYKQISSVPASLPNQLSSFPWSHTFNFTQAGRGSFVKIPVLIRRTYMDASLFGFDKLDPVRYIQ